MDFYNCFYYFLIYAFIGWISEVIYAYYKHGYFVNRGFLRGPFCPIYGFGAVSIVLLYGLFANYIPNNIYINLFMIFIYGTIITSLIEYITGYFLEKFFNTTWWDYSNKKFNLKGRICLEFSLYWGIASVVILAIIHPLIINLVSIIPKSYGILLMYILMVYFIFDLLSTLRAVMNFTHLLNEINTVTLEIRNNLYANFELLKNEASIPKINLIASTHVTEFIKNMLVDLKVNTDIKKYTQLSNTIIDSDLINNFKNKRKVVFLRYKKLSNRYLNLHDQALLKHSRFIKAFPGLKFKKIDMFNEKIFGRK